MNNPTLTKMWLFWVAPIIGAVIAGVFYKVLLGSGTDTSDRVAEGQAT